MELPLPLAKVYVYHTGESLKRWKYSTILQYIYVERTQSSIPRVSYRQNQYLNS